MTNRQVLIRNLLEQAITLVIHGENVIKMVSNIAAEMQDCFDTEDISHLIYTCQALSQHQWSY